MRNRQNNDPEAELRHYLDIYSPASYYRDLFIEGQYLFLTEGRIAVLFPVGEYSVCSVTDACDIVCTEAETVGEVSFLRITDRTGRTFGLTLPSDQTGRVLEEISALSS